MILDTFIEEEGMFDGLNDMIREKIAKNGIAKFYDDLVFEKEVSEGEFKNAIEVLSIDFYIDGEELTCTFDLTANPDYFFGHIATIEIDEDNQIEMGGING